MISHMGINATAASAATWLIVAAGDDGQGDFKGCFLTYIPQNSPPTFSYLFIFNAWV